MLLLNLSIIGKYGVGTVTDRLITFRLLWGDRKGIEKKEHKNAVRRRANLPYSSIPIQHIMELTQKAA